VLLSACLSQSNVCQPRCPPLAHNVLAAWRKRGFHCRSDGRKTCKSAQTFGRVTAPLAPNRSCLLHNSAKVEKKAYNFVKKKHFVLIFFVSLWVTID
jgi:hypothetical protein